MSAAASSRPSPAAMARYKRFGLAVMRATTDVTSAPSGYNDACIALWSRLQARRSVPTAEELSVALVELYDLLRDAAAEMPAGNDRDALVTVKQRLDLVQREARRSGLWSDE